MKKNAEEKIPARANNELILILALLLLAPVFPVRNVLLSKARTRAGSEKFAEAIINNESYLLDLAEIQNSGELAGNCPDAPIQELDAVIVSRDTCELISRSAGNWVRLAAGEKMRFNRAGAQELEFLPGIGAKRARDLLRLREELNGLESFDQLKPLPWVNARMLSGLEQYFTVKD